jgi:ribonuclease E
MDAVESFHETAESVAIHDHENDQEGDDVEEASASPTTSAAGDTSQGERKPHRRRGRRGGRRNRPGNRGPRDGSGGPPNNNPPE